MANEIKFSWLKDKTLKANIFDTVANKAYRFSDDTWQDLDKRQTHKRN